MDWYLEGGEARALHTLRRDIVAYLTRHGEPGADVDAAAIIVEEVVGNSVRHADGPVWVALSWRETQPTLRVRDLGPGFDPQSLPVSPVGPRSIDESDDALAEGGRGLLLVNELASSWEATARAGGGMLVSVELPVKKAAAVSHDPRVTSTNSLPALSEARPEGGFGKESFLRALVLQLAQTVEFQHGPDAGDAAVAQVGTDVGAQMEREFRAAEGIVGRMSPDQIARCYVRLKDAIGGGFSVIEANADRIVLANTRCPFGEAVRLAPSLCRMTSSVFGGIAARNSDDGAAVQLEERIAVGDPGCRVIVYLREPPVRELPLTHRYAKIPTDGSTSTP